MNKEMEAEAKALGARLLGGIPVFKRQMESYLWSHYGITRISLSKSYQDIWEHELLPKYGLVQSLKGCLTTMTSGSNYQGFTCLK